MIRFICRTTKSAMREAVRWECDGALAWDHQTAAIRFAQAQWSWEEDPFHQRLVQVQEVKDGMPIGLPRGFWVYPNVPVSSVEFEVEEET